MKKLFLAILLSIGIAIGGCAGTGSNKFGSIVSTIPNMEYIDLDFFDNGTIYKIPSHIRALDPIWLPSSEKINETLLRINFEIADEIITFIVDVKELKIKLIIYGKRIAGADKPAMEFYIYDGKQYPIKVTKEEAKAYMDNLKAQENI